MQYLERNHKQYITVAAQVPAPISLVTEPCDTQADMTGRNYRDQVKCVSCIEVLLVDDHALVREGLHQLLNLEEDIRVVDEAINGLDALQKVRQWQPDAVLMDINMPVVDGIAVTRQIMREFPSLNVIMLSMHCQQAQVLQALKCGAKGYLLKSSSAREVVQAIRRVQAGEVYIDPCLTGTVVGELRRLASPSSLASAIDLLSEKEIEIVRCVASGMSNREIAEALAYSEKTVKNYL
jgi:DNA-binding NarL/FixJ family response regulator